MDLREDHLKNTLYVFTECKIYAESIIYTENLLRTMQHGIIIIKRVNSNNTQFL